MARTNGDLLRNLREEADQLGTSGAPKGSPVILRHLVQRKRITSVDFEPLLVDAALFSHAEGFRMVLNCGETDGSKLKSQFQNENTERLMPVRLRFSIAHELAHTLFYDLSLSPPKIAKAFKAGGGKTALDNLEKYCNELAAHILLPTRLFQQAVRRVPKFTASALLGLAEQFGVSSEVLLRRFGTNSPLLEEHSYFCGGIFLVTKRDGVFVISALARPKVRKIAPTLRALSPGEQWQVKDADGNELDVESPPTEILLGGGGELQDTHCTVSVQRAGGTGRAPSYLVVFERAALL